MRPRKRLGVLLTVLAMLASGIATAQSEDDLTVALATGSSARIRAQAALALQDQAGDPAVREALSAALKDRDPIVRAAAAKAFKDAAPPEVFPALVEAALDADPLVSKWVLRILRRIVARAPVVVVDVKPLSARLGGVSDLATKTLQAIVMEHLLTVSRFDVPIVMDFDEDPPPQPAPDRPVHVQVTGEAVPAYASPPQAGVQVRLRVTTRTGVRLWEGASIGLGREEPPPPPDPDADRWTIHPAPTDARIVALRIAAQQAAVDLARALADDGAEWPQQRAGTR